MRRVLEYIRTISIGIRRVSPGWTWDRLLCMMLAGEVVLYYANFIDPFEYFAELLMDVLELNQVFV